MDLAAQLNNIMAESTFKEGQAATENRGTAQQLPTEIWLQVLEHDDPKHLWLSVRNVSREYQEIVERLFRSQHLRRIKIAFSLPRRDAASSRLKWPGDAIPGSQLVMGYAGLSADGSRLRVESQAVVKDRNGEKSVEELRATGILPRQRLEEAAINVNMSTNPMASLPVKLEVAVEWDEVQKRWAWDVEWRVLLSRFFDAKDRQGKRWPTKAPSIAPQQKRWHRRRHGD
jgi:hypothetical protein